MRKRLPNRRGHLVREFDHAGHHYIAGAGYDDAGNLREIFLDTGKAGSSVQMHASDAAILVSLLLQHGVNAAEIGHSVSGPIATALAMFGEPESSGQPPKIRESIAQISRPSQPRGDGATRAGRSARIGGRRMTATAPAEPNIDVMLDVLFERASELAFRVEMGQLAFIEAIDLAYSAALWAGLIDLVGDDVVQLTLAAGFRDVKRGET